MKAVCDTNLHMSKEVALYDLFLSAIKRPFQAINVSKNNTGIIK